VATVRGARSESAAWLTQLWTMAGVILYKAMGPNAGRSACRGRSGRRLGGDVDVQVRPPEGLDVRGDGDSAQFVVDPFAAFDGAFGVAGGVRTALRVEKVPPAPRIPARPRSTCSRERAQRGERLAVGYARMPGGSPSAGRCPMSARVGPMRVTRRSLRSCIDRAAARPGRTGRTA
jgi:hypothetical protein